MSKSKPSLPPAPNNWVGQVRKRNARIKPEDLEKIRKIYFVQKIEDEKQEKCECAIV